MKKIPLTQGKIALVSDHRYDYLNQWNWHALKTKTGRWYAARKEWGTQKTILMHRQIMNPPDELEVDHRNNQGLDNQDENLRLCTSSQNKSNIGTRRNNTSGYKGVDSRRGKWRVRLKVDGVDVLCKTFPTIEEAAKAYNEAAKEHFGEFARLNPV